ncbi:TKL family protein kinase [Trichomonas vaginalis G3]|uniref:TKL family protein kinase n=1 Tax=Trichomonas vaginalis (strain ATCC PRA-98 / G3) TaxID=412133 RepID=A2FSI4_TRIV3|nr:protein kinase protein [Trichomonas vaginalis G3]EAX92134.1 TKL family protein kinase [Trichomonas vaginalis G3]KAI5528919.1 protein kinase protein [Trichomonas vaginalis G3]|eukprot:XP_001305064.1 TKL family protein kinase [Trichomonas vaginalis G3]
MNKAHKILAPLEEYLVKLEDFTMDKRIGKGGYGEVWLATHNRTGQKCAVKKLFLEDLEGQNLNFFVREVTILASCHDFFLLPFIGFTDSCPFTIVTEFVPSGSLFEALHHKHGAPTLSASNKTLIAIGIAHGMIELHKQNIIHRDLKSLNILLDDRLLPKICDFGISRFGNQGDDTMTKEIGTPHWMAPEIFESNHYTEKVDVYAYGMILWEMLTESVPFRGRTAIQVATAVVTKNERPPIPSSCPGTLRKLIQLCWDRDPEKRPSFKQIYNTFCDRKVMYRDTDPRSIAAIMTLIKEQETKQQIDPLQHLISRRAKSSAPNAPVRTRNRATTVNFNAAPVTNFEYPNSPGSNPFINPQEAPVIRKPIRQLPPQTDRAPHGLEIPRGNSQPYIANNSIPSSRQHPSPTGQGNSQPYSQPNNAPLPNEANIFLNNDPLPPPSRAINNTSSNSQPHSNHQPKSSRYRNDLSNFQAPDFPQKLHQIITTLTIDESPEVFRILAPYLKPSVPMQTTTLVLSELVSLFRRDISFIIPFCQQNLHNELPFHYQGFIVFDAEIIFVAITQNITLVNQNIMSSLAACVASFPEQIINVFAKFASKITEMSDFVVNILTILFSMRNDYANIRFALHFVRIIYNLYKDHQWFREMSANDVGNVILQFFSNSDVQLLVELYNFAMTFKELRQFVPLERVVTHIGYPPLSPIAISFLIHLDNIPSSKRIVAALLALGPTLEVTLLLCRIAEQQVGAQILYEHTEWMDFPANFMFMILSSLFTVKAFRRYFSEHPKFPELMLAASECLDLNVRMAIPTIVRRASLTVDFVMKLNQVRFISRYIQLSKDSIEAISGCIMMCDALARVCYVSGFDDFIPLLPSMLAESGTALPSLTLTLVLYSHKEMREKIRLSGVKEVLVGMKVTPNFEQYRAVLLNQLNKDDEKNS